MKEMGGEVPRLAPYYFVQTPNLWFPIEPHFRSLFFALLPEPYRARRSMKRKHGFYGRAPDLDAAMSEVESVKLLDARGS